MNVLIALDETEPSLQAAEFASRLLSEDDEVVVVSVVEDPGTGGAVAAGGLTGLPATDPDVTSAGMHRQTDRVEEVRRHLRPATSKIGADRIVVEFDDHRAVADRVSALATDLGTDLIVVGTGDRSGLSRLWKGSVSRDLVAQAPCAVLVVR